MAAELLSPSCPISHLSEGLMGFFSKRQRERRQGVHFTLLFWQKERKHKQAGPPSRRREPPASSACFENAAFKMNSFTFSLASNRRGISYLHGQSLDCSETLRLHQRGALGRGDGREGGFFFFKLALAYTQCVGIGKERR